MVAEQAGREARDGQHDAVDAQQRADDVANVEEVSHRKSLSVEDDIEHDDQRE